MDTTCGTLSEDHIRSTCLPPLAHFSIAHVTNKLTQYLHKYPKQNQYTKLLTINRFFDWSSITKSNEQKEHIKIGLDQ